MAVGVGPAGTVDLGSRRAYRVAALLALAFIAAVGATALPVPFTGDQALFSVGGRALGSGKVLYRDFWDLKQPGIFVFYRAAGAVFGFGEIGVHAFELCWELATALLVMHVMRARVTHVWTAAAAAVLSVGTFYLIATAGELAMVESLVALPLLASVWLVARALEEGATRVELRFFAAGVFAFVVAFFKVLMIAVPVACWIVMFAARRVDRAPFPARFVRRALVPLLLGLAVPAALFVWWVVAHSLTNEVWRTYFQLPLGVNHRAGRPFSRLTTAVQQFVKFTLPVLLFAAFGVERARPSRRDPVAQAAVAWVVAGAFVYFLQLWRFDLLMDLLVPLGILGAYGLDNFWSMRRRIGRTTSVAALAVLVLSSGFLAYRVAHRAKHLVRNGFAIGATNVARFQADESPRYAFLKGEVRFFDRYPERTTFNIWADPLYLYLSGRSNELAVNGWAPEHYDGRVWRRVTAELESVRPDVVFIDAASARVMQTRGAVFAAAVARDYHFVAASAEGRWYERNR